MVLETKYNEPNWYDMVTQECSDYPIPSDIDIKTCLDVGCNVGGFVNAWKDKIEEFYCVDASESNIKQIKENTKDFQNKITIIRKAVYKKSNETLTLRPYIGTDVVCNSGSFGTTNFVYDNNGHGWRDDSGLTESVDTINIEDLTSNALEKMNAEEIDLLKVDVEGAEYDFMMDKDLSPFKYIVMELHNFLSKMPSSIKEVNQSDALHQHILKTHKMVHTLGGGPVSHYVRLYKRDDK
jgi:FkbM family methyltransferase